jgi:hypothetical protein
MERSELVAETLGEHVFDFFLRNKRGSGRTIASRSRRTNSTATCQFCETTGEVARSGGALFPYASHVSTGVACRSTFESVGSVNVMNVEVLVVQNSDNGGPGLLAEWLSAAGVDLDIVRVFAGEELPARVSAHGLLILGGAPSPRDDDVAPWFPQVRALLAAAVEDQVPTLASASATS